jgi:predicted PurR-regulated permease PerM
MMTLHPVAAFALIFFVAIFAIITVALLAALTIAVTKTQQQLEKLANLAEPLADKASNTLDTVQRITVNVGEKADQILTRGEALTENVSTRVEKTSQVVQSAVTTPLINFSSLISGLSSGLFTWSRAAKSGLRNGHPSDDETSSKIG